MIWSVLSLLWWIYVTIMSISMLWGSNLDEVYIIILSWLILMVLPFIFNTDVR